MTPEEHPMDHATDVSPVIDAWLASHDIAGTFAPTRDRREGPAPSELVWFEVADGTLVGLDPETVEAWRIAESGTTPPPEAPSVCGTVDERTLWIAVVGDDDGVATAPPGTRRSEPLGPLSSVPLEVTAEIGQTRVPLQELLSIQAGSILRLDRTVGEPVSLLVNGTVAAKGDIVVVGDRLGVRIAEIVAGGSLDR